MSECLSRVIDFEPEHLVGLDDAEGVLGGDALVIGRKHKSLGPCATLLVGDSVAACGGFHRVRPGIVDVWASISKSYVGPSVFRTLRNMISYWMETYSFIRLQSCVKAEWIEGKRTMQFLGFQEEGVLRKFGPNGEDVRIFARIR